MTTDRDVARGLADALDAGVDVALATVVRTNRSVPRRAGAKMLIGRDGRRVGTVGGGEMEARVVALAEQVIATGEPMELDVDLVDPADGDAGVCGGTMTIHVEPFMSRPHLVVIGCGHVGAAVVELAHWLGFRVTALDDRAEVADPDVLSDADRILEGPLGESVKLAGVDAGTHVVLLTRNVSVDTEVLPAVFDTPARSIGVMGSSRRWATTRTELAEAGIAPDQLDRVTSPVGVDIAAETPQEIALSIMTEIVELRRAGRRESTGSDRDG